MRRREFIVGLGGSVAVWPRTVPAQQAAAPVVGLLSGFAAQSPLVENFHRGLKEAGFVEGQIDYRSSDGQYDRLPALAADLIQKQVAVISTLGENAIARPSRPAARVGDAASAFACYGHAGAWGDVREVPNSRPFWPHVNAFAPKQLPGKLSHDGAGRKLWTHLLTKYLRIIVQPTVDEFMRNPLSPRHEYIACVVAYHAIDRVTYGKGNEDKLKKEWRKLSPAFAMLKVLALDLKHVKSNRHRPVPNRIPVGFALLGSMGFNTHVFNDIGQHEALRNISFLVQDVVKFLHVQAKQIDAEGPDARQ
jgi:hypothetical protein